MQSSFWFTLISRPLALAHTPVLCIYFLFPVEFFLTVLRILFVEHFNRVFLGCLPEAQSCSPMMLSMPLFYAYLLLLFLNYGMFSGEKVEDLFSTKT